MRDFINTTLFIDTALQATVVGLYHNGAYFEDIVYEPRGAAERLLPMMQACMEKAGCDVRDLDTVLTTLGPGSFTGLRVGLSVVKTMPLALDIQTRGMSTFDALALSVDIKEPYCIILESKRADFYVQTFGADTPFETPQTALPQDIANTIGTMPITGDGCARFLDQVEGFKGPHTECTVPNPERVISAYRNNPAAFSDTIDPIYLRGADVSFSKKPQRKMESV